MPYIIIMDTTASGSIVQQSPAYALMKRGKRGAAEIIATDCCNIAAIAAASAQREDETADNSPLLRCALLDNLLDVLLNPYDAIGEWNNLDWLRWLMAGGKTLDEFNAAVKDYDYGTCCGLVWTANYVAYRCRTCSISPCMSLCGDCFKQGDHTGHDFNMFRSQAGGACDCGDTSVMKPEGFCRKHSINNIDSTSSNTTRGKQPPADLLRVAERIIPRLLLRLVQYLRENSKIAETKSSQLTPGVPGMQQPHLSLVDLDPFLSMLHDLSALGAAMRRVMTVSLTDEKIYKWACDYYNTAPIDTNAAQAQSQPTQPNMYKIYTDKMRLYYAEAVFQYTSSMSTSRQRSLSNSEDDEEEEDEDDQNWPVNIQNKSGLKNRLNHSNFLQEIVFWTVRYEFPQKMVCFLLHMLPDAAYKESLTEAFVMHYGCVAHVLATTRDSDTLSNHIVHISVQLFSNEALATRMVDKLGLLRIMVTSLRRMMTKILIPSTLHDQGKNNHRVVDCSKPVMKEHCYWPLVSDLNNVLSHKQIAVKFMQDDHLLDSWFSYLAMFQGMNVNCQELGGHVEFEPNTYYAAFSAELEASAYPMWAMLSHLTSPETWPLASRVLNSCLQRLRKWLIDVGYYNNNQLQLVASGSAELNSNYSTYMAVIRRSDDRHQFTFHLPLHRYLAVFLCQAVRAQKARIEDIIPYNTDNRDLLLLAIAVHPIRAQVAFYEIMQGAWVRNGLQIKGQAMTYIQSNFCISMVDADIYLLQFCLSELSDANILMSLILEKFKVFEWTNSKLQGGIPQVMASAEYDVGTSMENLFVFLATLIGIRTNLCSEEFYDYCQSQLELVTLLCVSDKTHSQLMELMPERCGSGAQGAASSTSTRENTASQTIESPPSPFDVETVLDAVAEYKRPQFEASGNMQQGLYVPLAHVWRDLYDPVHVLLRAVHRRDFQSSMDRYTTFMRSVGSLKPNETPWPPFRTPKQHHLSYRDPRRALLTKLFQSVAWHCLYRAAVYRDVNEHSLSLLVYLLDQAWICNSSANNRNNAASNQQHQPMDVDEDVDQSTMDSKIKTDEDKFPKKKIQIKTTDFKPEHDTPFLLLERWFDSDDLVNNLCTTITSIESPPSFFNYYFGPSGDGDTSAASTLATNLFDYFTSSVAVATGSAITPAPISHDFENAYSSQTHGVVPSLASIASNEIPPNITISSQPDHNGTRNTNSSHNAATSTTIDSPLSRFKQQLLFLQQTTTQDEIPTLVEASDNVEEPHLSCGINESIISLLLRLHSALSGKPDSYQPPLLTTTFGIIDDEMTENYMQGASNAASYNVQEEPQPCGDGPFYVSRLLDRMAKGSRLCYECIVYTRYKLWPRAVVLRETATRENEERERCERKRRARDKQQKMMEEMAQAQRAFLENARLSGDLESSERTSEINTPSTSVPSNVVIINVTNMECDELVSTTVDLSTVNPSDSSAKLPCKTVEQDDNSCSSNSEAKESGAKIIDPLPQELTLTVDCVICNQTVSVNLEQQNNDPVGLVILIQSTSILAHRRHILDMPLDRTHQTYIDVSEEKYLCNDDLSDVEVGEQNYYHYWPTLPPTKKPNLPYIPEMSVSQQGRPQVNDINDTTTYAAHTDRRTRLITQQFNNLEKADIEIGAFTSPANNSHVAGNIHVQTCGHHLHLRCWSSYLASLRGTQRFNSDRGEYSCPLCRQLANSLLPLLPLLPKQGCETDIISNTSLNIMSNTITRISNLVKRQTCESIKPVVVSIDPNAGSSTTVGPTNENSSEDLPVIIDEDFVDSDDDYLGEGDDPILDFVNKCVNDMIVTTAISTPDNRDKVHRSKWHNVISIAWTNIQVELVQRNNSLMERRQEKWPHLNQKSSVSANMASADSGSSSNYNMLPNRNCMIPLLKNLRVTARTLLEKQQTLNYNPLSDIWYKLIGLDQPRHCYSAQPPLLLRDSCSILLQMVLLLPDVDNDTFDTLVRLVYNMQVYSSAVKLAVTWPHDYNFSHQHRQSYKQRGRPKLNKPEVTTEKIEPENRQLNKMDLDDSYFEDYESTILFSQAVSLAKSIVILSQDIDSDNEDVPEDDDVEVDEVPVPTVSVEQDRNMLLLESFGRQCTLPFLRFAALLKKYTYYGNNHYNLDVMGGLDSASASLQQQPSNLNMDQENKEQLADNKMYHDLDQLMKHSPLTKSAGWSREDHEFLLLAQYLKLLKTNNEIDDKSDDSDDETTDDPRLSMQPPSAMDAVIWPHWTYSSSNVPNYISTKIVRSWLVSLRESLSIPKQTFITQNSNIVLSATAASIEASKSTNVLMAVRSLFASDCCDGGGTLFNSSNVLSLLPTINWMGPRLVRLPHLYDDLFQYYHNKVCGRCLGVPRETSVCLLCGTVVCLKENCCTTSGIFEAVQHSLECGGGTSMFLVVTSSSVVVVRGKRACLWGSVYLDTFGEEDRELKRGKPLFLCTDRYRLLEHQWLAHRFDHTNKKWVWHRDAL